MGQNGMNGSNGSNGMNGSGAVSNDVVAGHWQWVSGPMVTGAALDSLQYLELAADGSGTLYEQAPYGFNGCNALTFAVLDDTVVAMNLPDLAADGATEQFYRYALPAQDTLTLTDSYGLVTAYQRTAAIPAQATCPAVTAGSPVLIQGDQPGDFSGLAADATSLWYTRTAGGLVALDPTTGATSPAIDLGPIQLQQYQWVLAIQGSDFWVDCACGSNTGLHRLTSTGQLVTSVDVEPPTTTDSLGLQSGGFDGGHLWVSGYDYLFAQSKLLELDTTTSPATTLASYEISGTYMPPWGIVFEGGTLWLGIDYVGPELVGLDPTTGTVVATHDLPRDRARYRGLAVQGGTVYALRSNEQYTSSDILPITGL